MIFTRPQQTGAANALRDPQLQTDLKLAGHRVSVAENETALREAFESGVVDLVLTDVPDADRVSSQAAAAPSKPRVLSVMYQPRREEARAIESTYQCRLKASDRADRYLVTLDDAMKIRVDQKKTKTS